MEWKIGEIKQIKGEWYQCVKGLNCLSCFFNGSGNCDKMLCSLDERTDSTSVFFKKLEKVGEPFTISGTLYQNYKVFDIDNVCGDGFWCVHNYNAKTLTIEIRQNEEDMEEKKLKISSEKADYLINKLQDILADYLHGGESDEVIAKFEELLDMEEKHSNSENIGKNLKEFNLEAAKSGKPVCTRDGRKARIICFDKEDIRPIVALIKSDKGGESAYYYYTDGMTLT